MVISIWTSFEIRSRDAVHQLQSCLEKLSQLSPPLHGVDATIENLELIVREVHITTQVHEMLVQVLNYFSLPQAPHEDSTGSVWKWARVEWDHCSFANQDTYRNFLPHNGGGICTSDDKALLGATLACRTSSVLLIDSPDMIQCLSTSPILDIHSLKIWQESLSTLECEGLRALLLDRGRDRRRGRPLKHLGLVVSDMEQPQILVQSIRNAIHLQELRIARWPLRRQSMHPTFYQATHDMVLQLLQNSQNRLQKLWLQDMRLQDHHFMAMVDTLPTLSCLELLDVQGNEIGAPGILALAAQLPRIQSLKTVVLESNACDSSFFPKDLYDECIAALIQGILRNSSIESLYTSRLEIELKYCTHPNWVRRHIAATVDSIPVGLWPLILERAGTRTRQSMWDDDVRFQKYRATALYIVLQNSPILPSLGSFGFLTKHPRKRTRVDQ